MWQDIKKLGLNTAKYCQCYQKNINIAKEIPEDRIMDNIKMVFNAIGNFLSHPIFSHGNSKLSVGMLIYLILGTWLIFFMIIR